MLLNYHIGRLVLSSLCVGDLVRLVLSGARFAGWSTSCASACNTGSTQNQSHQSSNTQWTDKKTTDVVIQQHSRKLLMMDILMSETCWAHNKRNKIASDIKLVFHSSTITMMHGPINIRFHNVMFTCHHIIIDVVPRYSPHITSWLHSNLCLLCNKVRVLYCLSVPSVGHYPDLGQHGIVKMMSTNTVKLSSE